MWRLRIFALCSATALVLLSLSLANDAVTNQGQEEDLFVVPRCSDYAAALVLDRTKPTMDGDFTPKTFSVSPNVLNELLQRARLTRSSTLNGQYPALNRASVRGVIVVSGTRPLAFTGQVDLDGDVNTITHGFSNSSSPFAATYRFDCPAWGKQCTATFVGNEYFVMRQRNVCI